MSEMVGTVENEGGTNVVVKDVPDDVSPGSEGGASERPQGREEQAGASQDGSDSGSADGQGDRQRGKSVYARMRELQARLNDQRGHWETEVGGLKSQIEELKALIASSNGRQTEKPRKTFWEAPEEILEERLSSHMTELEKRMQTKFEQTQEEREQASIRSQEVSEAAKFIRSQKDMTDDDIQDIREILRSKPYLEQMPPMEQAQYALSLWQKQRGIRDTSGASARASSVTAGAAPSAQGVKNWKFSEMESEMKKFPVNPSEWTPEQSKRFDALDAEFRRAIREKRVTQ